MNEWMRDADTHMCVYVYACCAAMLSGKFIIYFKMIQKEFASLLGGRL